MFDVNEDDRNLIFEPIAKLTFDEIKAIQNPILKKFAIDLKREVIQLEKEYRSTAIRVGRKTFYMNANLQETLDHFIKSVRYKWDTILCIDGIEGCLTGDTIIRCSRATLGRKYKLKWMYNQLNGNPEKMRYMKKWDPDIPTYIRSFKGKYMGLHKITGVTYSGKKQVYLLTLSNGRSIKATSTHKILTRKGWKELCELKPRIDEVMCDEIKNGPNARKRIKLYDVQLPVDYHPYSGKGKTGSKRVEVHRLIYEARLNNIEFPDYLDILLNEPEIAKTLKYIDPSKQEIHHKDGCHYNNGIDNLELLDKSNHRVHHSSYDNFNQGVPSSSIVKSIIPVGVEDTYDIQCTDPHHNFSANDIIVHNSAKSTVGKCVAWYLTKKYKPRNKFNNDNIVFTPQQFMDFIDNTNNDGKSPGQVLLFDEFVSAGLSTDMNAIQNALIKKFTMIRKKRMFIILVIPYIFMLRTYFAIARTKLLIHVWSEDFITRGNFSVYGFSTKHQLFFDGTKGSYKWKYRIRGDFDGTFLKDIALPDFFTNDAEYEKKKDEATLTIGDDGKKKSLKNQSPDGLESYSVTEKCFNCKKTTIMREKETGNVWCPGCEEYKQKDGIMLFDKAGNRTDKEIALINL